MLSDSLHEACELIWDAVENYNYSGAHKDRLIESLTKLGYIIYKLDRIEEDCVWSEEDYKNNYVLRRWSSRPCGADFSEFN